jgi:GTP-binding protein YchF
MKLGIIGKPQCGKTSIFNAASGQQAAVGDFSQASHRAIVKVPDERVDKLTEIAESEKTTYAEIELLDAPGFTGKGKASGPLEISPDLRQMDALIAVIDGFSPESDPKKFLPNLMDEMILSDQVMIENNLEKKARKIKLTGDKSAAREMDLLKQCLKQLEAEKPLIDLEFEASDVKLLHGYGFLSSKPILVVLNISEDQISQTESIREEYSEFIVDGKRELAVICGAIEMELATLGGEDRQLFMEDLGIEVAAVDKVIQKSYRLLGLISFLTMGPKESRAWPIRAGISAVQAAGAVHSDISRGFIRAEVTTYEDILEYRTPAALKAAGKIRLEGKNYVVKDGDEILFRFNV